MCSGHVGQDSKRKGEAAASIPALMRDEERENDLFFFFNKCGCTNEVTFFPPNR